MQVYLKPLAKLTRDSTLRHPIARRAAATSASVIVAAMLLATPLCGWGRTLSPQTSRPQTPMSFSAQKADQAQKSAAESQRAPATASTATQSASPATNWPVNDAPSDAAVVWDGHGLRIEASNSSLAQILKDVAAKTGANLQGMGEDQRVFGTFGPGPAREVLSELLEGSGYNVLMIGDRGEGAPRRIVLSVPSAPGSQPSTPTNQQSDADSEADQQPQEQQPEQPPPPPPQNNPGAPVPVRPPQEIMREMQQRQLMLQQQQLQQQQQQQNPQN
jgi:hypothetical protein